MNKTFKGVWGTFPYLDETAHVVEKLQEDGRKYDVIAPCPRHEIHHAMGLPQSRLPFITLVFGALGIFFGFGFPSWVSLDWVLPVSQKPIVSIPAFTVIGFELMVLLGGISTAIGIFVLGFISLAKMPWPKSQQFKSYDRFSVDRFGVIVSCDEKEAAEIEKLMKAHSAEEVVREF